MSRPGAELRRHNTSADYSRLLELLIQHTRLKNLEWKAIDSNDNLKGFFYRATNAGVFLQALNQEQTRLRLVVADGEGSVDAHFVTEPISPPEEAAWDERIRELWDLLNPGRNPVKALIAELEDLPPF